MLKLLILGVIAASGVSGDFDVAISSGSASHCWIAIAAEDSKRVSFDENFIVTERRRANREWARDMALPAGPNNAAPREYVIDYVGFSAVDVDFSSVCIDFEGATIDRDLYVTPFGECVSGWPFIDDDTGIVRCPDPFEIPGELTQGKPCAP